MAAQRATLPAAALLAALAALLGVAAQFVSPTRIPWTQDWSRYVESRALDAGIPLANLDATKAIIDTRSHLVLDARKIADYDAGHIPGAMSLPHSALEESFPAFAPMLTPDLPILVYCSGKDCDESLLLGDFLRKQGFTNVTLYVGGFLEWKAAGLPVE